VYSDETVAGGRIEMREVELRHVVEDLASWAGGAVTGAWQPTRTTLVLGLGGGLLRFTPRGPLPRLHSVERRAANPPQPFSFQGAVRAHLMGRRLRAIDKHETDRVVDLRFGDADLHLRLTGRSGGLWLHRNGHVVASLGGPSPLHLPALPPGAPRPYPPRFTAAPGESWDLAARTFFESEEQRLLLATARRSTLRDLGRELDRNGRLVAALERDLDRARTAPDARARADALAAVLHTVPRGTSDVTVQDLTDPEITHALHLDPRISPAENMNRMYRRAGRLQRAEGRVVDQLERARARRGQLVTAYEAVPTSTLHGLRSVSALTPSASKRKGRQGGRSPSGHVTWRGPGDARVLVGKSGANNRRLTFQVARADDIWMHIRDRPGAHVVIPLNRGASAPLDLLLAAAQIALVHAKVPTGTTHDVQYTRARNVRSIPGEATGRVLVTSERVLHVTRDPGLLNGWTREAH
jgi:predicted ribosome quality control (RQC) complex YloA/Tae2 family protein